MNGKISPAVRLLIFLFLLLTFFCPGAEKLRVVSLSPSLTELVFQLGQGDVLVGRSSACDHPGEAKALPAAGGFADPDPERVLKLKPDLVLTNDLVRPGVEKVLTRAGIRLIRMQCRNLDEYIRWVEELGKLLNCPERAASEIARVKKRLDSFRQQAEQISPKKKVCWVIWDSPLMIAGADSLPETLIDYAGGVNLARGLHPEYIKASRDWLLKNQPDILIWTCSRPVNRKDPFWRSLEAVRRGRIVFAPDSSLLLRPGPRLPDGIEFLKRELEKFR